MINFNNKTYICKLDFAMSVIRSKWKAVILCHLKDEPIRYMQLQRITSGISHKVLNDTLKQLEQDKLIRKIIYDELPLRVEYELTQIGKELSPVLHDLEVWGEKYMELQTLDSENVDSNE